jgi:hypothetical protein
VELRLAAAPEGAPRRLRLLLDHRNQVHPRQVLALLTPLAAKARASAREAVLPVLVAPYISPRVSELCIEHGIGYLDAAGNAHLVGAGLFVHIEGRDNPAPDTRPAMQLFAAKSSRIARVLLEEPQRVWQVQGLAAAARVSIGLASRIKCGLVDEAYLTETVDGVRVVDAPRLLHAWSAAYRPRVRRCMVYGLGGSGADPRGSVIQGSDDPSALVARAVVQWCSKRGVPCAHGEMSAASLLAPMVRPSRPVLYIGVARGGDAGESLVEQLFGDLDLKPVESGPTAEIWVTDDESIFFGAREVGGMPSVSPLQAYLDVVDHPARGREAAEEIELMHLFPRFTASAAGGRGDS